MRERYAEAQAEARRAEALRDRTKRGGVLDAGSRLFDVLEPPRAWWGEGSRVLGARGEALMLAAYSGVGKTTLAQRLALALVRVAGADSLLGLPVAETERVLYVSADRPAQAVESLRRMVTEHDRAALARLVIHQGPPETRITEEPEALSKLARRESASLVIVDSLKDVVLGSLADDSCGSSVAAALQDCAANGIEVVLCHHTTKLGARSPSQDSVYGSTLIPSTCGSVLFMTGGDVVKFSHVKSPAEAVDVSARLDRARGAFLVADLAELARGDGVTAQHAALALFGSTERGDVEKARRKLEADARFDKVPGSRGGGAERNPARYVLKRNHAEESA
jgi:hypothetical protein